MVSNNAQPEPLTILRRGRKINTALVCLAVTISVPPPLDRTSTGLGTLVAEIAGDGDVEVRCHDYLWTSSHEEARLG